MPRIILHILTYKWSARSSRQLGMDSGISMRRFKEAVSDVALS